jgi:glutathione S-transferase
MAAQALMKLYWSWFINPQKVRFALNELALRHELHEVHLLSGEQRDPRLLALNPNGKAPVIEHDGVVLWESNAILSYLADTTQRLWPYDSFSRGDALRWMFFEANHLQASIGVFWFSDFVAERAKLTVEERAAAMRLREQVFDDARRAEAHRNLRRFLPILERHLSSHAWMLGREFSLVDCCYGPQLDALMLSRWPLDDYPGVGAYVERVRQRPAWQLCEFRTEG